MKFKLFIFGILLGLCSYLHAVDPGRGEDEIFNKNVNFTTHTVYNISDVQTDVLNTNYIACADTANFKGETIFHSTGEVPVLKIKDDNGVDMFSFDQQSYGASFVMTDTNGVTSMELSSIANYWDAPTSIQNSLSAHTLNTGQGANELYVMDQDVTTTSDVIFDTVNASAGIFGNIEADTITIAAIELNEINVDTITSNVLGIGKDINIGNNKFKIKIDTAVPILDQVQDLQNSTTYPAMPMWQSIEEGFSGYLTEVIFAIDSGSAGATGFEVYEGEGNGGTLLYSQSISFTPLGLNYVYLDAPLELQKGHIYTIQITGGLTNWTWYNSDVYLKGRSSISESDDMYFKMLVSPVSVLNVNAESGNVIINKSLTSQTTFQAEGNIIVEGAIASQSDEYLDDYYMRLFDPSQTLDQQQLISNNIDFSNTAWQSITSSQDGYLKKVSLDLGAVALATVRVEIYEGQGTGGTLLATSDENIGPPIPDGWNDFTFSSPAFLTNGQTYSIHLNKIAGPATFIWEYQNTNVYAGGRYSLSASYDAAFETYMRSEDVLSVRNDNQRVGINKSIPSQTLDVEGTGAFSGALEAASLDTGQGANELYDMDQNVLTTSTPTFGAVDTGQGNNELYAMDQDVQTTDDVTFSTVTITNGIIEKGTIEGFYVTYNDTTSIIVTEGKIESNDKYFYLYSDETYDLVALSAGFDIIYIYIDDDASTEPTAVFIDTTTEPIYDSVKKGWYNSDDRCIGSITTSDTLPQIVTFDLMVINEKNIRVSYGRYKSLATNMNPDTTWQTPNTSDTDVLVPVNANSIQISMNNTHIGAMVLQFAASKEIGDLLGYGSFESFNYQQATIQTFFFSLGSSRKIYIKGEDNDDNFFSAWLWGMAYSR